jgi:hypothetical protein
VSDGLFPSGWSWRYICGMEVVVLAFAWAFHGPGKSTSHR